MTQLRMLKTVHSSLGGPRGSADAHLAPGDLRRHVGTRLHADVLPFEAYLGARREGSALW